MAYALALISALIFMIGLRALITHELRLTKKRNQILADNVYFVGHSTADAVAALGPYTTSHDRWLGQIYYYWGTGDSSVLLISGADGKIVDYCPERQESKYVLNFFSKNNETLIGRKIWDIKKMVGESHSCTSFDFGIFCDHWKISKNTSIEVLSKNEICTEINFKT